MKTTQILLSLCAVIMIQGCAKQKAVSTAPGSQGNGDQTQDQTGGVPVGPSVGSNKIVLSQFNANAFKDFMAPRLRTVGVNQISSIQPGDVTLDLFQASTDTYGGEVKFNFNANGVNYNSLFQSTANRIELGKCKTFGSLATNARYNKTYTKDGKEVWHGFFQDCWGAIIVVIDGYTEITLGDGDRQRLYNGSVFFKNFQDDPIYNAQGHLACWDITVGPFDCRTFLQPAPTGTYSAELAKKHPSIAYEVNPVSELYPNFTFGSDLMGYNRSSYTKLGQFSNLDFNTVFGN